MEQANKKAVIFQHMLSAGPGSLVDILQELGFAIEIIHTAHQDIKNFDALTPDLLIIMGGSPGVYQADHFPFLHDEMRIIRERVLAGKPYLGICLGAQLMAQAMGGRVYKGTKGSEVGWQDITLNEAGLSSPIKYFDGVKVMQWHGDTFETPSAATLLASSDKYAQVFSLGDHAIGFQCHIEMKPEGIADWMVQDADYFVSHDDMRDNFRTLAPVCNPLMTSAAKAFMKDWLALNKLI